MSWQPLPTAVYWLGLGIGSGLGLGLGLGSVWLPPLLVWLCLPCQVYPSLFRRLFCAACASWLVALQFLWTWNFVVEPNKRVNLC